MQEKPKRLLQEVQIFVYKITILFIGHVQVEELAY
jgi:hypothetical protein